MIRLRRQSGFGCTRRLSHQLLDVGSLFLFLLASTTACVAQPRETLTVATLNLAHGRGLSIHQIGLENKEFEANIDAIAKVIVREKPQVLAIQEADAASAWSGGFDHVTRLAAATNYAHIHHGLHFDVGYNKLRLAYGTALLADRALEARTSHRFAFGQIHTKGFVTSEIELAGRVIVVVSVHFSSESRGARRKEAELMIKTLGEMKKPIVLMGDLNSRWSREKDAARLLAAGLKLSAYRPKETGLKTYRANAPHKRIDWILISQELEFAGYGVWADRVSDHLGVHAEIRWRK